MNRRIYCGLDVATRLGIAVWNPLENVAHVTMVKGEPIEQVVRILEVAGRDAEKGTQLVFVMEVLPSFQNGKTTRSLLERYGYIKYTLMGTGFPVQEVHLSSVRRSLGVTDKMGVFNHFLPKYTGEHLLTDHTDALAVAVYQSVLDKYPYEEDTVQVHDLKDEVIHVK